MKNLVLLVVGLVAIMLTGCGSVPLKVGGLTLWRSGVFDPLAIVELPAKPVRFSETSITTLSGDSYYHSQGSSVSGHQDWSPYGYSAGVYVNTWNNTTVSRGNGYYYSGPWIVPSGTSGQVFGGAISSTTPYR
jgi:hypothetical protein